MTHAAPVQFPTTHSHGHSEEVIVLSEPTQLGAEYNSVRCSCDHMPFLLLQASPSRSIHHSPSLSGQWLVTIRMHPSI